MKKILVTGGTGFVGNYVVNELLKKECQVVVSSANPNKAVLMNWYDKVKYIPFNLDNFSHDQNYYEFFDDPDQLIHLAWEGLPNYKSSFHLDQNLPRHSAFLENLIRNGLRDITVTGTCFEYGMQEGCLSETMEARPENAYARAKDKLRVFLTELGKKVPFDFRWVRLFYMYGQGQSPNSLLSQLQSALSEGEESFNMSPGDQLRDYLPIEKVAEYIVSIATQRITGITNCCSGKPLTVKQLVIDYLKENNKYIKLNLGFFPYSDIEPKNFWGDTAKLKTILKHE